MIQKKKLIKFLQKYEAIIAISPSAMRNQGKGILKKVQKYCANIELSQYKFLNERTLFIKQLEKETTKLMKTGLPWGVARKVLNLFLRNVTYNAHLRKFYKLQSIESFLEIPLDSIIAKELKKRNKKLPEWSSLRSLTHDEGDLFQNSADRIALQKGIYRVHLDVFLWTTNR
jgi:N-glycosylase/DNA lyase